MSSLKEKKISKRDMIMRIILAAIIVGLLAVFGFTLYKDNQGRPPAGVLDVYPESTIKAIRDLK